MQLTTCVHSIETLREDAVYNTNLKKWIPVDTLLTYSDVVHNPFIITKSKSSNILNS